MKIPSCIPELLRRAIGAKIVSVIAADNEQEYRDDLRVLLGQFSGVGEAEEAFDHGEAPAYARMTITVPALAHGLRLWREEAMRKAWPLDGKPDYDQDARYLMGILLSDECDRFYQPPDQFFREPEKDTESNRVAHGICDEGASAAATLLNAKSSIGSLAEEAAMAAKEHGVPITITITADGKTLAARAGAE